MSCPKGPETIDSVARLAGDESALEKPRRNFAPWTPAQPEPGVVDGGPGAQCRAPVRAVAVEALDLQEGPAGEAVNGRTRGREPRQLGNALRRELLAHQEVCQALGTGRLVRA